MKKKNPQINERKLDFLIKNLFHEEETKQQQHEFNKTDNESYDRCSNCESYNTMVFDCQDGKIICTDCGLCRDYYKICEDNRSIPHRDFEQQYNYSDERIDGRPRGSTGIGVMYIYARDLHSLYARILLYMMMKLTALKKKPQKEYAKNLKILRGGAEKYGQKYAKMPVFNNSNTAKDGFN